MGTCPNCGEIVMEGDPYCSNCGTTFSWSDDREEEDYSYSGSSYSPRQWTTEDSLRRYADEYRNNLKRARDAREDREMIRYYNYALDSGERYWDLALKNGITDGSIPKRGNLLEATDVDRCSRRHYALLGKYGFFTNYETLRNEFENILKKSGNSHEVSLNKSKREEYLKEQDREYARSHEIWSLQNSRENYFKYLKKANADVERSATRHAIGNYRNAIREHENYFSKDYEKYDSDNSKLLPQPPENLTDEARYHMLELYKKTHPLLKSSKKDTEINSQVVEILGELHRDDLEKADCEVQEIARQRQLERQRQKEKIEGTIVDGVVAARIVGDRIYERLRNR